MMRDQKRLVKKYSIHLIDDDQELSPGGRPLILRTH